MDERLGEARINPDRQVEVLERTTGLTDRRVGQTTRIECWRLVWLGVDGVIEFADRAVILTHVVEHKPVRSGSSA
jgi:hypothetical protein